MADGNPLAAPVRAVPTDTVQRLSATLEELRRELLALHPEAIPVENTKPEVAETRATINRQIDAAKHHAAVAVLRAQAGTREGK